MKYAHIETERRFLISSMPEGVTSVSEIWDLYVIGTRLRLRKVLTDGRVVLKLGQKIRLDDGPGRIAHTTMYLNEEEWNMLSTLPAKRLHKVRHQIERAGVSIAIDEHGNGTLIAEIDGGEQAPNDPPDWLPVLKEVTHDEQYTGGELATC